MFPSNNTCCWNEISASDKYNILLLEMVSDLHDNKEDRTINTLFLHSF